jgi:rhomboid protease GluP
MHFEGPNLKQLSVTHVIIAINGLLFLLTVLAGADLMQGSSRLLVHWGASYRPALRAGQWWRLATANWLHFGLMHFALNALALSHLGLPARAPPRAPARPPAGFDFA